MKAHLLMSMCCLLACGAAAWAQRPGASAGRRSGAYGDYPRCASRTAVMDGMAQHTPADELIIVVARIGSGDKRPDLNRRRLHNVRAYWTEFLPAAGYRRRPETVVLAEGERVEGYGRLEFYVGGKLVEKMNVARNSDVDFGNCYPPDDSYIRGRVYDPCRVESHRIFYPCRDRRVRRGGGR